MGKWNPYEQITHTKKPVGTPAQEAIRKALVERLEHKLLTDISVKELCAEAHVARTTFYSYYGNTDQALCEIEDGLIYDLVRLNDELMDHSLVSPEELLFSADTYRYVQENQKIFHALLISHPDLRFIEKWKQGVKYHLWERLFAQRQAKNAEFILEMVASLTISAHTWFLKNPDETISPDEICGIISQVLQMLEYV